MDASHAYISAECLPESTFLQDPSKMRSIDVNAYWTHWTRRQEEGKTGLIFKQAVEADMHPQHMGLDRQVNAEGSKDTGSGEDGDESETDDEMDEGGLMHQGGDEGGQNETEVWSPHPESPAAHAKNRKTRREFLEGLSDHKVFQRWMKCIHHAEVCFLCHSM